MSARRAATCLALLAGAFGCSIFVDLGGISDEPVGPQGGDAEVDAAAAADAPAGDGESGSAAGDGGSLRRITFENGALVDPSLGADELEGQVLLESTNPIAGLHSARIAAAEGSGVSTFTAALPRPTDVAISFALRVALLPSGSIRIVRIVSGGLTSGELKLQSTGELTITTPAATSPRSAALAPGTTYTIRIAHSARGGLLEVALAPRGQAPGAIFGSAALYKGASIESIVFGQTVATNYGMDIAVDDILIDPL